MTRAIAFVVTLALCGACAQTNDVQTNGVRTTVPDAATPERPAAHVPAATPTPTAPTVPHVRADDATRAAVARAVPTLDFVGDVRTPCGAGFRDVATWLDTRNGLSFVLVPAGSYTAGAPDDGMGTFLDAAPRPVRVPAAFLICTTELNVKAARDVGMQRYRELPPGRPAGLIRHHESMTVCGLLGYDLPTEDEWEWAARGAVPDAATCAPTANGLGLTAVTGGLWEWCKDRTTVGGVTGFPIRGGADDAHDWQRHVARREVLHDSTETAENIGFRPVIRFSAR